MFNYSYGEGVWGDIGEGEFFIWVFQVLGFFVVVIEGRQFNVDDVVIGNDRLVVFVFC